MATLSYTVPNINCGHCVHTIKMELSEMAGVKTVEANQETKLVEVVFDPPATEGQIKALLTEINYPPVN